MDLKLKVYFFKRFGWEFNRLKQDVITCYVRNVTDFIYQRKQRTAMNGTSLKWANVVASVSQGSMFRPLFFLIYINDLNFLIFIGQFNCKSKAACVWYFFSVDVDVNIVVRNLSNDFIKISEWALQWKINFNPNL